MTIQPQRPQGLSPEIIDRVEDVVITSAKRLLTARRFLDFEGPLGGGLSALQVGDRVRHPQHGAEISARRSLSVPEIDDTFTIAIADIEATMQHGFPLDLKSAERAAENVALAEEHVVYYGVPELGIAGLASHAGVSRLPLANWSTPEQAVDNLIAAADRLDAAGARGPLALVLAPTLYNALFRKYEGSDVLALDHIRRLADGGIFKAHALDDCALLTSPDVGPLVSGNDLHVRYLETTRHSLHFVVSESIVLRLDEPTAACLLAREAG
jgi:uncharacterized linocin/CFP29 family protein